MTVDTTKETKSTVEAVVEDPSQYTLKFDKPWDFEGEKYTELKFDFNKINGRKLIALTKRLDLNDMKTPVKAISMELQAAVCAEAAGVPMELILELPANYFSKVTVMAQNFLLL
ncbi:phage tail assembly protein [Paenibacillus sp. EKM208P]|nr:phage tail assembly protein [Paenibacillus sp. EKM208P]